MSSWNNSQGQTPGLQNSALSQFLASLSTSSTASTEPGSQLYTSGLLSSTTGLQSGAVANHGLMPLGSDLYQQVRTEYQATSAPSLSTTAYTTTNALQSSLPQYGQPPQSQPQQQSVAAILSALSGLLKAQQSANASASSLSYQQPASSDFGIANGHIGYPSTLTQTPSLVDVLGVRVDTSQHLRPYGASSQPLTQASEQQQASIQSSQTYTGLGEPVPANGNKMYTAPAVSYYVPEQSPKVANINDQEKNSIPLASDDLLHRNYDSYFSNDVEPAPQSQDQEQKASVAIVETVAPSKGKMTPGVLIHLARLSEEGSIFNLLKELQDAQNAKEDELLEKRNAIVKQYESEKLAREIMAGSTPEKEREAKRQLELEIKRYDMSILEEMEVTRRQQQRALETAGVPLFKITDDLEDIIAQQKLLSLLESMAPTTTGD
ncbi:uncharacterized protein SPPG_01133 [Spizellomyces punctatus DAOM BR117]|uniref:Uncharacterized protein n=1 Tax=Spizellomyces punctatus (strain DAOM BR117) TaxID=645134 RepID=A0A0L0HRH5_SPIPD|nr:uncharacterized protein SPPG_01133 [Spizellomyces punctatus DAOM BR117]KND03663.1 hypothetical protein SPPG_01133 [Spizellomyces punctatus DAOM BR117]|eukprot:XP_016611702.1 hypothetical protein SPPG_01133 [Spizellomyces punctatus DAOM BR117]